MWEPMETGVKYVGRECLFRAEFKGGGLVPRLLGNTVHGTEQNRVVVLVASPTRVLICDLLDRFVQMAVVMEDLSS